MENLGGLWGSSAVAKSLENLQASYYFYKVENAGHEISGLPMSRNQYDIMSFLSRQVLGDENLAITTENVFPVIRSYGKILPYRIISWIICVNMIMKYKQP